MSIKDARGNDPLEDAIRENRTSTINYLNGIKYESLIRSFCSDFQNGILRKGMQQALGIFHKKMSDLQLTVASTPSNDLLKYLNSTPGTPPKALTAGNMHKNDSANQNLALLSQQDIMSFFISV